MQCNYFGRNNLKKNLLVLCLIDDILITTSFFAWDLKMGMVCFGTSKHVYMDIYSDSMHEVQVFEIRLGWLVILMVWTWKLTIEQIKLLAHQTI